MSFCQEFHETNPACNRRARVGSARVGRGKCHQIPPAAITCWWFLFGQIENRIVGLGIHLKSA